MSAKPSRRTRRFVSPSVRQRRCSQTTATDLPRVVTDALREIDDSATRWPTALEAPRLRTDRDDLCAAYFRSVAGFSLFVDRLIRTDDHLLVVVNQGNLIIESAGCPFAIREGGSALVPPGSWRITEAPVADQVGYWLLFFSPALLGEAIGDDEQVLQLASQVTPIYRGVFVQPRLLDLLRTWGQATPVTNMVQTIRAMAASMSASFYMYLREHYYAPQRALQDEVRRRWIDGAQKIGQDWPGGPTVFRRELHLYHAISVNSWAARWIRTETRRQGSR